MRGQRPVEPFFIIGSGRSGNTLLRRVLQAHSELHIPPENHALGAAITIYRRNRGLPWPHLVDLILGTFQFSHGFDTFELDLRLLADQLHNAPDDQRNLAFVLDSFYRFHADSIGKSCVYWGDKTPLNTFNAFKIASVFPDARFIHMVRDGIDVVESYVRADLVGSHDEAADRWARSVKTARHVQKRYPGQFLEVRYEALVREPASTIECVCTFLEIDFEPRMLTSIDHASAMGDVERYKHHAQAKLPIHTESIGRGRRSLDSVVLATLREGMGSQLRELGYET